MPSTPPCQTTRSLLRRPYIDAHADAVAGAVGQLGHLAAAVVHVGDAVAIVTLFPLVLVTRLATLHRVFARRHGGVPATAFGLLRTDCGADDGSRRGGRVPAPATTDLMANDGADHAAKDGATGGAARQRAITVATFVVAGFVPAFALRRTHPHSRDQRLDVDDARVVVLGAITVVIPW